LFSKPKRLGLNSFYGNLNFSVPFGYGVSIIKGSNFSSGLLTTKSKASYAYFFLGFVLDEGFSLIFVSGIIDCLGFSKA
jgi:hypothetical protein